MIVQLEDTEEKRLNIEKIARIFTHDLNSKDCGMNLMIRLHATNVGSHS